MSELLTPSTTPDEAASLLATGKVSPSVFSDWMAKRLASNGNGNGGWHPTPPRLKVSEKGCLRILGCHNIRFGLTLYVDTVEYLYRVRPQIEQFIAEHQDQLSRKQKGET